MPIRMPRRAGLCGATMQLTCYHAKDDGGERKGLVQRFEVLTLGQFAGTSYIEVAHYAAPTLSFVAPNTVNDAGGGLATILAGDKIVIKGSPLNEGTFDVLAGGVAGSFTTVQNTIVNELAGAYVKLYKRTNGHSNNCVRDLRNSLMWARYASNGEKVGEASTGLLIWADATKVYPLHPAAADLAMIIPGNIVRIVGGAAELPRYDVGDLIDLAGFASAPNNVPGYPVTAVAVVGADLDVTIDPSNQVLVNEAAGGARSIGFVTRGIYNYAAGANIANGGAGLGGYTDWRNPDDTELASLRDMEAATAAPNAAAFPAWPTATSLWSSTSRPDLTTEAMLIAYLGGSDQPSGKVNSRPAALVRGGL